VGKTVFIVTDRLGRGNAKLGAILMTNFVYTLARAEKKPDTIMLMNEGVRLVCAGSESLDDMALLAESGVAIKACGTCLDFLGLRERHKVGVVGDIVGAVDKLMADDEVVTIA
jgi:selenium metabolism protein YedF